MSQNRFQLVKFHSPKSIEHILFFLTFKHILFAEAFYSIDKFLQGNTSVALIFGTRLGDRERRLTMGLKWVKFECMS